MNPGEKIKIFAKSVGGLAKLAELMNMSASNLSQYANNHSEPGLKILQRLHDAGCDMNWFFSELLDISSGLAAEPKTKYDLNNQSNEIEQLKERLTKLEKLLK